MKQPVRGIAGAILDALVRGAKPDGLTPPEVVALVDRYSLGATRVQRGTLYTTLDRLQEKQLIESKPVTNGRKSGVRWFPTDLGKASHRSATELRSGEWNPGTHVKAHRGSYEVVAEKRYRSPARMFEARRLHKKKGERLPSEGVIKTAWPHLENGATADPKQYAEAVLKAIALEIPTLERLKGVPSVAQTFDWGERYFKVGSDELRLPFLVQEKLEGTRLSAFVKKNHPNGFETVEEWFDLSEEIVRNVVAVQDRGTVYRNISPSTIVLRGDERKPVFADFGEGLFAWRVTNNTLTDSGYIAPELIGKPPRPSRTGDVYAIGCVLFYIATGQPPNFPPMLDDEELKQRISDNLMRATNRLLEQNFGIADIISRCLRFSPERRPSARELLRDIQLFKPKGAPPNVHDSLRRLLPLVNELVRRGDPVFQSLAAVKLAEIESHLEELRDGRIVITGDHDSIVSRLSAYLAAVGPDCRYDTVSTTRFWLKQNLGVRGRFLSMNFEAARKGAHLRRIFLLCDADRTSVESVAVLKSQLEMQATFNRLRGAGACLGEIETFFRIKSQQDIELLIRNGAHRGVWIRGDSTITLTPDYSSKQTITSVRIERHPLSDKTTTEWFDTFRDGAIPLDESWARHAAWDRLTEARG
jgi:serine/threonine protein kinase